jgi:hypothetical protein
MIITMAKKELQNKDQDATTIITAQAREKRKGRKIHRLEAISRPMKSTAKVDRVNSEGGLATMGLLS